MRLSQTTVKFLIVLLLTLPTQRSYAQSTSDVAALGVGVAALFVGAALTQEVINEQLEAFALDHLLEEGLTGAINIQFVQRQFANAKSYKQQGAYGSAFTFLVTSFDPKNQTIKDKRVLLLLVSNRGTFNSFGVTYKPYIWIDMDATEWTSLVQESVKTIAPVSMVDNRNYLYKKTESSNADFTIINLDQEKQNGNLSSTSLIEQIVLNDFDKIKRENLSYDLTGDSYVISEIMIDQENISVFQNENSIGLYSPSIGCHSLLKLKDLSYINRFIFN
tara:strand:- start:684 stop:1511 length:828 start_codon:yes stop_codon:yes gene_type:complete